METTAQLPTVYAEIGSVSHATMREEDLIPCFVKELRDLGHDDGGLGEIEERMESENYYGSEDAMYDLHEYLFDALNDHAPDFCYFGSHPGDGCDYGFWPSDDAIEDAIHDGEIEATADLSEVWGDDYGDELPLILLTNDHGNRTLYRIKREYTRIVFAQGEDADEPLRILDEDGTDAAMDYLAEWDYGDGGDDHDTAARGDSDDYEDDRENGLILSWNTRLGYIGLERLNTEFEEIWAIV